MFLKWVRGWSVRCYGKVCGFGNVVVENFLFLTALAVVGPIRSSFKEPEVGCQTSNISEELVVVEGSVPCF